MGKIPSGRELSIRRSELDQLSIWVDFANSPQVLFFKPIIDKLAERDIACHITARQYSQTVKLMTEAGISGKVLGKHGGMLLASQIVSILKRAFQLAKWAIGKRFDISLSHNSYSQLIASRIIGLPSITFMDFEHQPLNHLAFRLADVVIVPEVFPSDAIDKYGARQKSFTYGGIKEQVYISNFVPESIFRSAHGLFPGERLIVFRPPAPWAAYHRGKRYLFEEALEVLISTKDNHILVMPRTQVQRDFVNKWRCNNVMISEGVLDGPQLVFAADLVVSGGGTMTREAAILGTPAISIFQGKEPAVDKYLEQLGRMNHVTSDRALDVMADSEKLIRRKPFLKPNLIHEVVGMIIGVAIERSEPP